MERHFTHANMSRVNLDGPVLLDEREGPQRGRGEAENSVTWDHTASDYLLYQCYTCM